MNAPLSSIMLVMNRKAGQPPVSIQHQEGRHITLVTLTVGYLIVSFLAAIVFYCACAVGARAERAQVAEIQLDQSDLDYQFSHLEWAEKANS
jgi:heme/copper-type cytochrome/quinol oxidase subunit 2